MAKTGYYLVLATALVSGISIFLNKWAVEGLNPYIFTWSKNILVAIFMFSLILLLREWREMKALKARNWALLAIIGFVGGSIPFLMFFKGLQMTSAANAAFIHKTMFIYVAVLAAVFLKERLNLAFFAGALLLLAGNYLLLKYAFGGFDAGSALVFGATLFWAAENTLSKYVLREVNSRIVAFGRMFFGSLFILAFLVATGNIADIASITLPQVKWILFTSILLLLYVATWYEGLRTVPVSVATCILLLGSVITTSLQFAFLGTEVTLVQGIGMLLLLIGIGAVVGVSQLRLLLRKTTA